MPPAPHRHRRLGPRLLPGALVVRRDARTLQVGTGPGLAVADRPGLRRLLNLLDGSLPTPLLAELVARDVPEFVDDLDAVLTELIAIGAVLPPDEPASGHVVRHDRSTADFAALISPVGDSALEPRLEVLVSAGEPPRSTFETLTAARVLHLPVMLDERRARIGPLVSPGATPCLSCLDALLTSADPRWPALLPQFEQPRLLSPGLSPRLRLLAAAEVLREVELLLTGQRPTTVGRTVSVEAGRAEPVVRAVPFAQDCPCALLAA